MKIRKRLYQILTVPLKKARSNYIDLRKTKNELELYSTYRGCNREIEDLKKQLEGKKEDSDEALKIKADLKLANSKKAKIKGHISLKEGESLDKKDRLSGV